MVDGIYAADAVALAFPIYYYVPGHLKTLIDRSNWFYVSDSMCATSMCSWLAVMIRPMRLTVR